MPRSCHRHNLEYQVPTGFQLLQPDKRAAYLNMPKSQHRYLQQLPLHFPLPVLQQLHPIQLEVKVRHLNVQTNADVNALDRGYLISQQRSGA